MPKWLLLLSSLSFSALSEAAIILQYHHVSTSTPKSTSVTPAEFRQQLQHLKDQNFKVVSLERIIKQLQRGEALEFSNL